MDHPGYNFRVIFLNCGKIDKKASKTKTAGSDNDGEDETDVPLFRYTAGRPGHFLPAVDCSLLNLYSHVQSALVQGLLKPHG